MTHRRLTILVTVVALIVVVIPRAAVAQQPEMATSIAFTEGPTVDRDGNVYFTEMVSQRIMKLTANGVLSTFRERSNNANGLLIDPQGRLVACEGAESQRTGVLSKFKPQITRTDLRTGKMEVLADNYQGKPFVGPNDVTIDGKGRLYFTDLTGGAVYRIDGPGQLARILAAAGHSAAERDSDLTRRQAVVSDRSERRAGRRAHDPRVRSARRRHRWQHAGPLQLLSGPKRGRHEHRYAG